jgi:membrane protein YdbS with pleckstrin-like domain
MTDNDSTWKVLSPRYIVEAYVGTLAVLVGPLAIASVPLWVDDPEIERLSWFPLVAGALIAVVALGLVPRRVRAMGYQLRQDDLVFRRGIIYQRYVAVPYGRLQLVDISRGPLSRLLSLSELRLVTAAASTGVTIPGLLASDAENLRDHLIAVAETRRAGL